tara:strand:+ start:419 stop:556 length:138 start_codon:yes stop_codon:yes gene_type:complete
MFSDWKRIRSQSSLEMVQAWCKDFENNVNIMSSLTDSEYLSANKE